MWLRIWCGFFIVTISLAAYAPDEVINLPGIPAGAPPFKQYSGYLNATGDKKLHYWFVESQSNPITDPLLLWLNGGPGCSSLDGYLSEIGPFHVNNDGATLYLNEYSWNKMANVVFLESPAGVGFSYSPSMDYKTDDDKVAQDNYLALQDFFVKFPEYAANPFYITGESYGGIYIPTLATKIQQGNATININMKGIAIGNGLLNVSMIINSAVYFAYYHALFDQDLWNTLQTHCCWGGVCYFYGTKDPQCQVALEVVQSIIKESGINTYSIYNDCSGGIPVQTERYKFDMKSALGIDVRLPERRTNQVHTNTSYSTILSKTASPSLQDDKWNDLPCVNATAETAYLNRSDVRAALHIPDSVQDWEICSETVATNYTSIYQSMATQIKSLLPAYRLLIYNGDVDIVCNFLGDQWFVTALDVPEKVPRRAWMVDNQVAGFAHDFNNVTFATVKGSGHMVPQWKPAEAYHMITQFLNNQPL